MANETIREKVDRIAFSIADNVRTNNLEAFEKNVDEILSLIPSWKSFKDEKPKVGDHILIRLGDSTDYTHVHWDEYDNNECTYRFLHRSGDYQWYKIPK